MIEEMIIDINDKLNNSPRSYQEKDKENMREMYKIKQIQPISKK